jgi:broad specificity phosphatase PhoE
MRTRVLLLRHAESADPSVFHGAESDIGLSKRGEWQARAIAAHLATQGLQAVVSSAMRRAIDTATPLAEACGLTLQVEAQLHERRVGALGGTPTGRPDGPWMETARRWIAGDTSFSLGGAESFDEMRARIVPAWERIALRHAGKTYAVVAHGAVIKALLLSILPGRSAAEWLSLGPIQNVAITELTRSATGVWEALRLNDRVIGEPGPTGP